MSPVFDPAKVALRPLPFIKSLHVLPSRKAIYVNNAKVACSTIKLALQRAELGDPEYQPAPSVHSHETSPLLTWPVLEIGMVPDILREHFTFSFVRCPYGRLQSAFANKIVPAQRKGKFRVHAGFAPKEEPSFDDFVESVTAQEPTRQNPHWRPQWINLSADAITFDFIGRLEEFSADWQRVADRLDLPRMPQRAGKSSDRSVAPYSRAAAERVRAFYARDFEVFGYDTDPAPYLAH